MKFYKTLINTLPIKKRYLLQFGYIGTQFSGVQRQGAYEANINSDVLTIQGLLECALKRLNPLNEPRLFISSRTDAGVHAFKSTANVDLEFPYERHHKPYYICRDVNKFFRDSDVDIRLHNLIHVPDYFSARFQAIWRKYVYRIAVIKDDKHNGSSHNFCIPMTEHDRCHYVLNHPFVNLEAAKQCAALLEGVHDFTTFMATSKENRTKEILTRRSLHSMDISPGRPFFDTEWDGQFVHWNFTCVGRSFLYKQVRKMVTALIAVAQNELTIDEFRFMLENPSIDNWPSKLRLIPSSGLYLMDIGYRDEDLVVPKSDTFSLVLVSNQNPNKLKVIKLFRELQGDCTILEARERLASLPCVVRTGLTQQDAMYLQTLLDAEHCTARVEREATCEPGSGLEAASESNDRIKSTV